MPTIALVAVGAGIISAVAHAALLTGSFGALILAYLAQLPLFLIGLWMGFAGSAVAAVVALVVLMAVGGVLFAVVYLIVNAVPAIIVSYLAQLNRPTADGGVEFLPPGVLIGWLVGVVAALFLIAVFAMSGTEGGIEAALRRIVENGLRQMAASSVDAGTLQTAAVLIARFMPGVMAASWIGMVLVNAALAQGALTRFGRNLRPSPGMASIDLPGWMWGAMAIVCLGTLLPGLTGFVSGNLALIFGVAYVLSGLAVLHSLAARSRHRNLLLTGTYVFLFMFGWPIILLVMLGLAEPWLNLRRRVGGGTGT
jgi:hypothetical protein